jgi:hypothetical protein
MIGQDIDHVLHKVSTWEVSCHLVALDQAHRQGIPGHADADEGHR